MNEMWQIVVHRMEFVLVSRLLPRSNLQYDTELRGIDPVTEVAPLEFPYTTQENIILI